MRIATSTLFSTAVSNMNNMESTIADLQQQVSTGVRVNTPADDPVAAAGAVRINQQIARNSDLASNRQTVESSLNTVDSTLSSVNTLLTNVKSELVSAGNGSLSSADRKTLAGELQTQMQDLLGYANTQDGNGEYLFSGYQTATQPYASGNFASATAAAGNAGSGVLTPGSASLASAFPATGKLTITGYTAPTTAGGEPSFTYDITGLGSGNDVTGASSSNGQVSVGGASFTLSGKPASGDSFTLAPQTTQYQGDSGVRNVEVADGHEVATNLNGLQLFGSVPTGNGSFATSAATANTGSGTIDQGTVVSAAALTKDNYQVEFNGTGSVTASTSNSGGVTLEPGTTSGTPTSSDQFQLRFSGSGGSTSYDVLDTTTGATVSSGNAWTSGSPVTVNGVSFTLTGTPTQGDNFSVGPGAGTSYNVVDTTTGSTVLSNQSYAAGSDIQFAGMSFAISGTPNGGDSFSVAPSSNTSVFAVMQSAIDALNSTTSGSQGNTALSNALASANNGIDAAMAQVSVGQSTVGGRLQELSALDSSGTLLKTQYQKNLSTLVDTDMTSAISDLSQAQISLTAAQKSFVSVENLSIFNYISS